MPEHPTNRQAESATSLLVRQQMFDEHGEPIPPISVRGFSKDYEAGFNQGFHIGSESEDPSNVEYDPVAIRRGYDEAKLLVNGYIRYGTAEYVGTSIRKSFTFVTGSIAGIYGALAAINIGQHILEESHALDGAVGPGIVTIGTLILGIPVRTVAKRRALIASENKAVVLKKARKIAGFIAE